MKRLLSVLLFSLSLAPFAPAAQLIDASARGWVCTTTFGCSNNNGANPANNSLAGFVQGEGQFRDWFEFDIATLTGSLVSATLNLDEPAGPPPGHLGGSLTYTVYGLAGQPMVFTDVTTTNPFGSVGTSSADNGTTISITLDSAALADIVAHQGGHIFIGGVDSGENNTTIAGDFVGTGAGNVTSLSLNTAPVPEPASISLLFAPLLIGSLVALRRKDPPRPPSTADETPSAPSTPGYWPLYGRPCAAAWTMCYSPMDLKTNDREIVVIATVSGHAAVSSPVFGFRRTAASPPTTMIRISLPYSDRLKPRP
jgi:hypothetical protein